MDQLALSEDLSAPMAYVPKQEQAINRLRRILAQLQSAQDWPWEPVIVKLYKESTLPQRYVLIADEAEAEEWRQRIEAELLRLKRVMPIEPTGALWASRSAAGSAV
jgi:hypothetical protein